MTRRAKVLMPGLALLHALSAGAGLWTDNCDQALKDAKAQSRFVLLDFTGSDWCGWCKRLDAEVFSHAVFKQYARDSLICVTIDFPRSFTLKLGTAKRNEALRQKYGVGGFPTIVILDPNGKRVAATGYESGGAEKYVAHLRGLIAPHASKFPAFGKPAVITSLNMAPAHEMRKWVSLKAGILEARLETRTADKVTVRKADGTTVELEIELLSDDDHEYLDTLPAR